MCANVRKAAGMLAADRHNYEDTRPRMDQLLILFRAGRGAALEQSCLLIQSVLLTKVGSDIIILILLISHQPLAPVSYHTLVITEA